MGDVSATLGCEPLEARDASRVLTFFEDSAFCNPAEQFRGLVALAWPEPYKAQPVPDGIYSCIVRMR